MVFECGFFVLGRVNLLCIIAVVAAELYGGKYGCVC